MMLIARIIQTLFTIYWYLLVATALLSFVPDLAQNRFGQLITRITDPFLNLFRKSIRPLRIGSVAIDLSWIVAIIVFVIIQQAVGALLGHLVEGTL